MHFSGVTLVIFSAWNDCLQHLLSGGVLVMMSPVRFLWCLWCLGFPDAPPTPENTTNTPQTPEAPHSLSVAIPDTRDT